MCLKLLHETISKSYLSTGFVRISIYKLFCLFIKSHVCFNFTLYQFSATLSLIMSRSIASSLQNIVCAQCFHWFATDEALTEITRVLVPGGKLCKSTKHTKRDFLCSQKVFHLVICIYSVCFSVLSLK